MKVRTTKTSEKDLKLSCSIRKMAGILSISEQYSQNIETCKIPKWSVARKTLEKKKRLPKGEYRVVGYDTESVTIGEDVGPFLSGFWGDDCPLDFYHSKRVYPKGHLLYFLQALDDFSKHPLPTIVFAHNLEWDMVQILISMLGQIKNDKIIIPFNSAVFEMSLTQPCFGSFRQCGRRTVFIRDSFAFFKTSLKEVAKAVGINNKEPNFPDIGKRVFSWEEMGEYFEGDLKAVHSVGSYINQMHSDFSVPECTVSVPHFASSVFRMTIQKPIAKFPYPKFGLQTYYGGKTRSIPGVYQDINCYDVNSEYPFSMTKLPKLCCGSYEPTMEYKGPWGVYVLNDYEFNKCQFGTFYHNKTKVRGETLRFLDSCTDFKFFATGWDIEAALYCGSLKLKKACGYYWKEKKCKHDNIFQGFVNRCYLMRNKAKKDKNEILSLAYKLILNSLYGKFSQFRYEPTNGTWKPGALFDPCVAGMITAYGRYLIHTFEHAGNSIYTSTDSIFTTQELPTGENLGDLKHEFKARHLIILRNKVYFAFDARFKLIKWAGHGLQCDSPLDLMKAFAEGESFITKTRLLKRKEGVRRKIKPGSLDVRIQNIEGIEITEEMRAIFLKAVQVFKQGQIIPQSL